MKNRAHARVWTSRLGVIALAASGLIWGGQAQAANVIWTGNAGDGLFETGDNWGSGSPPKNNDWEDTAVFGATATAGEVTVSAERKINGISFETAGWTLSGSSFSDLKTITSGGAGTNTFANKLQLKGNQTWTVGAGNTLYMNGASAQVYVRNNKLTVTGGGMLQIASSIGGYGSGAFGIEIADATLQMDTALLFASGVSSNAYIALKDDNAVFRVAATEAQVNGWIGGRIQNQTAHDLVITDLGDGYMQVSVPEPAALSLLSLGGLLVLRRRK